MRKIRRLRLFCLILGAVFLALGVALQLYLGGGTITKQTLEFPPANNIRISCTALDMSLHSYDGDVIRVEYTNDLPLSYDTSEEGVLRLTQDASFSLSMFSLSQFSYRVDIYLPQRAYRDFKLDSTSGDIYVDDIDMLSLDISTRSGKIDVIRSSYPLTVASQRGDISISAAAVTDDISIKTGSGTATLSVPDFSSFTLDFTTDGGYITSDIFDEKYLNAERDVTEKYGTGRNSVTVNTQSGGFVLSLCEE